MEEKHLKTNIAQYALIIRDKKMLVLWPAGDDEPLWVLPGGRLNEDDGNYVKSLDREVDEEIGVGIRLIEPFYVDMYEVKRKAHRYAVFFLCDLDEGEIKLSHEHYKHEWLSFEQLMDFVKKEPERGRAGIILLEKLREKGLL
tara:strand:- start:235 stop:663 length:429 start_codon:yes stop_codon:yes gene_type:complete